MQEFVAVTQRRLVCTAQYGALLMSILAVTVRLVDSARALLPASERNQAGEAYFELAQDFVRISKNKLDIRHILALYRWSAQSFSIVNWLTGAQILHCLLKVAPIPLVSWHPCTVKTQC